MQLWLAIVLVLVVDGIAAGTIILLRRRAPAGGYFANYDRAAGVLGVGGTIYAVLVGFVFLLAFQSFQNARSSAQDEALAAIGLADDAAQFAAPYRHQLQSDLVCYGRAVVAVGWPLMSAGEASPLVEHWSLRLTRDFDRVTPRGPAQRASVQNWPVQADDLARGRHGRLAESTRVIPTTIWILLLVAGGAVIAFTVLFADPSERIVAQLALALSVATAVAASLLTVNFLDVPYGNQGGAVEPTAMRSALVTMNRVLTPGAKVACDSSGRPS